MRKYVVPLIVVVVLGVGGAVVSRVHNGEAPLPSVSDYFTTQR